MNNKGFISMTIVYTFLALFLFLVLAVLSAYSEKIGYLTTIGERIRNEIKLDGTKLNTEVTKIWYNECSDSPNTLKCKLILSSDVKSSDGLDFTKTSDETNTNGLYYIDGNKTEEGKRVYFYRGNFSNNNIIYNELCFKIIRIDENGNIRLIYNGEVSSDTCPSKLTLSLTSTYNDKSNDNKYIGYMYSSENDSQLYYGLTHRNDVNSTIKNSLDEWYENNLSTATKVVDAIYCNDKTVYNFSNGNGFANMDTIYSAQNRISNLYSSPTYVCPRLDSNYYYDDFNNLPFNNMFSTTNIGNGKNKYPIGLITADEVVFAGIALGKENTSSYLSTGVSYMTMTPYGFSDLSSIFVVADNGSLTSGSTTSIFYYAPVITIDGNSNVLENGTGSFSNPYKVVD